MALQFVLVISVDPTHKNSKIGQSIPTSLDRCVPSSAPVLPGKRPQKSSAGNDWDTIAPIYTHYISGSSGKKIFLFVGDMMRFMMIHASATLKCYFLHARAEKNSQHQTHLSLPSKMSACEFKKCWQPTWLATREFPSWTMSKEIETLMGKSQKVV